MASVDTVGGSPSVALPSPKAYRQPRRRPAHLRTKTGCLTCRKRKKKCDELRRRCNNCTKQNIECIWKSEDQTPAQSHPRTSDLVENAVSTGVASPNSDHSISEISSGTSSPVARSPGPTSPADNEVEDCTNRRNLALGPAPPRPSVQSDSNHITGSIIPVPYSYSTAITPQSGNLFDFLKCKFLPELIRPAAYAHLIDSLSRETLMLALDRPHCMHALLACCGAEIPTHDQRVRQLASFHYTRAVEGLRKGLSNENIRSQWMVTMLTVMMLCIYERANPKGSTGVEVHLAGAARMIQLGAQEQFLVPRHSEIEHAMDRLVQESFIFHVATSLPFQSHHESQREIDIAFQLAEDAVCPHFRPEDLFYANSPVLGFPPKLFRCIYLTYRLHQRYRSNTVDLEACQDLDQDLQRWNHQIKALESGSEDISGDVPPMESRIVSSERSDNILSLPSAFLGQRLYILGCQILLYRMSSGDTRSGSKFHGLIREAIDAVRALQPGYDYFAEYYCWPLLAIGMNLDSQADRQLLMSKAQAFWIATNNGTMKRLVNILDLYWDSWKPFNMACYEIDGVGEIDTADDVRLPER